jgi:hypothetical protein
VGRAFGLLCRAESFVATPIGTSLVCEASRAPTTAGSAT